MSDNFHAILLVAGLRWLETSESTKVLIMAEAQGYEAVKIFGAEGRGVPPTAEVELVEVEGLTLGYDESVDLLVYAPKLGGVGGEFGPC